MTDRERDVLAVMTLNGSFYGVTQLVRMLNIESDGGGYRQVNKCPWCPVHVSGPHVLSAVPRTSRERMARVLTSLVASGHLETFQYRRARTGYRKVKEAE